MLLNRKIPYLRSHEPLTQTVRELGIKDWAVLVEYVRSLPYGRNKNRSDLSLVLKEGKGTCSSKHALLKAIADENQLEGVSLWLVIFKMDGVNTSSIAQLLEQSSFDYIPEAHCVIQQHGFFQDVTNPTSDFSLIEDDVLYKEEIQPKQVGKYKVDFHREYLKKWLIAENRSESFEDLWALREKCIDLLIA